MIIKLDSSKRPVIVAKQSLFFNYFIIDFDGVFVAYLPFSRRVFRKALLLAAWEGEGAIDYGSFSDIEALNHPSNNLLEWLASAGFTVSMCDAVTAEEMAMEAVYIQASVV